MGKRVKLGWYQGNGELLCVHIGFGYGIFTRRFSYLLARQGQVGVFSFQGQRVACVNNTQLAFGTSRCYCILMLTILHDVILSPGQVPPCCQSVSTSGMSGLSL